MHRSNGPRDPWLPGSFPSCQVTPRPGGLSEDSVGGTLTTCRCPLEAPLCRSQVPSGPWETSRASHSNVHPLLAHHFPPMLPCMPLSLIAALSVSPLGGTLLDDHPSSTHRSPPIDLEPHQVRHGKATTRTSALRFRLVSALALMFWKAWISGFTTGGTSLRHTQCLWFTHHRSTPATATEVPNPGSHQHTHTHSCRRSHTPARSPPGHQTKVAAEVPSHDMGPQSQLHRSHHQLPHADNIRADPPSALRLLGYNHVHPALATATGAQSRASSSATTIGVVTHTHPYVLCQCDYRSGHSHTSLRPVTDTIMVYHVPSRRRSYTRPG